MNNVGLYIHIPFCAQKCNYCDFYSIKGDFSKYDEYINLLNSSFEFWGSNLSNRTLDTIYIGGGTPSVLGTENICKILNLVKNHFNVSSDAEVTIEINPDSGVHLDFKTLHTSGINRVSMGLQSIKDDELRLLGRLHDSVCAKQTIEKIRLSGIDNFSLDVMLGIPHQTINTLNDTLKFCVDSGASHISTYMLKIENNTPFAKNYDKFTFADEDTQADMYEFTSEFLKKHGFRHYEISNFCKENKISRHNMKYWQLDDYIGIGPAAHSMLNNKRFYYPRSIEQFSENNIQYESEGKTKEEYLMLSLRTDTGFSQKKYKELFRSSVSEKFILETKSLEKLGLLNIIDDSFILTEKGFLLSNTIISRLLNTGI